MSIYASAGYFVAFFAVDFFTFSPDPTRVVAPDPDATGHVGKRQKRRPEPEQPRVEVDVKLNAKRSIIPQTVLAVLLAIQPVVTGGIYLTTLLSVMFVGIEARELGRRRGMGIVDNPTAMGWTVAMEALTLLPYIVDVTYPSDYLLAGLAVACGVGATNQLTPRRLGGPGTRGHAPQERMFSDVTREVEKAAAAASTSRGGGGAAASASPASSSKKKQSGGKRKVF